jgi:hypothetical protein
VGRLGRSILGSAAEHKIQIRVPAASERCRHDAPLVGTESVTTKIRTRRHPGCPDSGAIVLKYGQLLAFSQGHRALQGVEIHDPAGQIIAADAEAGSPLQLGPLGRGTAFSLPSSARRLASHRRSRRPDHVRSDVCEICRAGNAEFGPSPGTRPQQAPSAFGNPSSAARRGHFR